MSRADRGIALLIVSLLLAAACGRPDETPGGTPAQTAGGTAVASAGGDGTPPTARGADTAGAERPNDARRSPATATPARANDGGNPGANAPVYLRRAVPRLVVELDAVEGKAPTRETVALVHRRLTQVADKPGGIEITPPETIPARGGTWSFDELRAAEARYRDTHTTGVRASLYLLFVDGTPPKPGAIGMTYSASAAAIFVDQIADASTLLVTAAAIERAATVHEVGHLLSLVNFGYTSPRDHEDPEHPGHSRNEASVMFWAVDNVGVVSILGGRTEPPTEFDDDDLADLADIRAGKLP